MDPKSLFTSMLQGTWRHYKGGTYTVQGVTYCTTSGEPLVMYRRAEPRPNAEPDFSRPLSEFLGLAPNDESGAPVQTFRFVRQS